MVSLKQKLFKVIYNNETKPLFDSQKNLVELICSEEKKGNPDKSFKCDKKRKASIQIFLSNCINGKRSLSKTLKSNLNKILKNRLKKNDDITDIIEDIFNSFYFIYKSEKINDKANVIKSSVTSPFPDAPINKNRPHQAIFDEFLNRSEKANSILRITPTPGEITGTKTGNKMIEFISDSIGLYNNSYNPKVLHFFFPNENSDKIAIEFWKNLYTYNISLGILNLEEKIIKANINNQINIYSINDSIANFPVTCLDYSDYHEFLYSTNLVEDVLTVMPLNSEISSYWKHNVQKILSNKENFEITFSNAKEIFENRSNSLKNPFLEMQFA